jgi:glycosyltransferase involved in cell wall biosynthesis
MNTQLQNNVFFPARGGIENYLYYASKTLLKLNHKPTILCSRHLPNLPMEETYEGIRILRHPSYSLRFPASLLHPLYYLGRLQRVIEKYSGDIDVVWSRHPCYCYSSCKTHQVPVVYIQATVWPLAHELLVKGAKPTRKLWKNIINPQLSFIEERAMLACDRIVVFSKINRRHITDYYGISSKKFRVIQPGVDLERFDVREKDEEILKELKVPRRVRVVLTVTRLIPRKNVHMLIEVLSRIDRRDVYLVVVGDGPQRAHLEKLTKGLGMAGRVRFVGFREDVERFYSIADVFALPSMYEPFGHVFFEAMASGVPCIGLKAEYPEVVTACDEIIDDGRTGYTVEPSIEDLKVKIEKIISGMDLKKKMGKEARKTCERRHSWEKHVKEVLRL